MCLKGVLMIKMLARNWYEWTVITNRTSITLSHFAFWIFRNYYCFSWWNYRVADT
ncbi:MULTISPECIES: hypothetical protein [Bacillus cereus group]|uniref:hypothetical protein n=1 Tax=Bacillus cereus group TaxID=86661 RepID=UPI001A7E958B|nr:MULTISPECIES: hypothetical protein [Bacillus cereus group]